MSLFGDDFFPPAPEEEEERDEDEAYAGVGTAQEGRQSGRAALFPPREMSWILGHGSVESALVALVSSGRMPHALIFGGREGIGKATMAFRLARFLLKYGRNVAAGQESLFVDPADPVFTRVAAGGHPDLLTLGREPDEKGKIPASLAVEQCRKIAPFLRMTASAGGWRIVIVDDADTMTRSAQNAILKILEEPPSHCLLILVAHRPSFLIPTIRSRSRVLSFAPQSCEDIGEILRRGAPDLSSADVDFLTNLSEGSAGQGLRYARNGTLDIIKPLLALVKDPTQWTEIHKLAEQLGAQGQENACADFQSVMFWLFSRAARASARGTQDGITKSLQTIYTLENLVEICEKLEAHFTQANTANLDRRQTVLGAFTILQGRTDQENG